MIIYKILLYFIVVAFCGICLPLLIAFRESLCEEDRIRLIDRYRLILISIWFPVLLISLFISWKAQSLLFFLVILGVIIRWLASKAYISGFISLILFGITFFDAFPIETIFDFSRFSILECYLIMAISCIYGFTCIVLKSDDELGHSIYYSYCALLISVFIAWKIQSLLFFLVILGITIKWLASKAYISGSILLILLGVAIISDFPYEVISNFSMFSMSICYLIMTLICIYGIICISVLEGDFEDDVDLLGHSIYYSYYALLISVLIAWKIQSLLFFLVILGITIKWLVSKAYISGSILLIVLGIAFLGAFPIETIFDYFRFSIPEWWIYVIATIFATITFSTSIASAVGFEEWKGNFYETYDKKSRFNLLATIISAILFMATCFFIIKHRIGISHELLLSLFEAALYLYIGGVILLPVYIGRMFYKIFYSKNVTFIHVRKPKKQYEYSLAGYQCSICGTPISSEDRVCPKCGVRFGGIRTVYKDGTPPPKEYEVTEKTSKFVSWLCYFLYICMNIALVLIYLVLITFYDNPEDFSRMIVYCPLILNILIICFSYKMYTRYIYERGEVKTESYY